MDRSTAILERFRALYPREIDLSLDRMTVLLDKLGQPGRLPPVIHVAGTNGKGSTTAFLRAMLEAAGKSVHVYTSPHLVRFHERIRIGAPGGGRFVDEDELIEALIAVEQANDGAPITQFEITTAAAFQLFAEHPADYLLLEVGLGGRYDATNVVAEPLRRGDHADRPSTTRSSSATRSRRSPARRPASSSAAARWSSRPQRDGVIDVIEAEAARLGAPVFLANRDWIAHAEHGRLVYQDEDGLLDLPAPRLVGRHQFTNAGVAIAALRQAEPGIADRGHRGRAHQRRLAGAHAAADRRPAGRPRPRRCRDLARRRPQSRPPVRSSPRPWPISRSACRARSS